MFLLKEILILILLIVIAILIVRLYHEKVIKGSNEKHTFIILSEYFDITQLANFLKKAGWKSIKISNPPTQNELKKLPELVDFVWLDGKYKFGQFKPIVYHKSYLRPFVKIEKISNKAELYILITKKYPKMAHILAKSYIYPETNLQDIEDGKYIIRPSEGYNGSGLKVVRNKTELEQNIKELRKIFDGKIVISKYLTDLILFDNKIFHIRYFIIVGIINGKYTFKKIDLYIVVTAKENFSKERETEKEVFDSHFKYNSDDFFLEELHDYDIDTIKKNIQEIINFIKNLIEQEIECYSESKNCYEILGIDLMVQKSLKVILIEVNNKVGLGFFNRNETTNKLRNMIFSTFIDNFLIPLFPELKNKPLLY